MSAVIRLPSNCIGLKNHEVKDLASGLQSPKLLNC
jgi:hypothetical protein